MNDKEQRKHWLWGLSPGNTISLLVLAAAGLISWGFTQAQVVDNKEDIQAIKKEFNEKLDTVKKDLSNQMQQFETRTRADNREMRRTIIKAIRREK